MNKTRHIIAALALDRYDVTPATDGNDGFTQIFAVRRRGNDFLQTITDLGSLGTHMPANVRQFRTCGIRDLLFAKD